MVKRVLVVEDEVDLVAALVYSLERADFEVSLAYDGETALRLLSDESKPDVVILDLMLPDMGGLDICRHIRQNSALKKIPVVMLTAKSEEIDRVKGFEVGADDYVSKPFSTRELILRIKAVLRRSEPGSTNDEAQEISFGLIRVDMGAHRAFVGVTELELTALEYKLLTTFLGRRGQVQTREILLRDVWEITAQLNTRTVDTHIKRLRTKLGPASNYIETLRGVGYRMRERLE